MKDPKIFPALFIVDEETLTNEEIASIIARKSAELIQGMFKNHEWKAMSTGSSYLLVPHEAVRYGEETGMFPRAEGEGEE